MGEGFVQPGGNGLCPKCGEWKFVGHGPLCMDCYRAVHESGGLSDAGGRVEP